MAKIATKEVYDSGVVFSFTDDQEIKVDLSQFSEDLIKQLAVHGLSQKCGDSYSGSKDVEEARGFLLRTVERLEKGEWKAAREGGEGGSRVTDLARALAEVTGKDLGEVLEKLDGMDKSEKLARRKHPAVAAVLARMAAEKAQAKAKEAEELEESTDGLL